ncbi:hypothetical protein F5H01DRAFT_356356 [Linnemannia elongata]|nr:hypothetical protein F5H01DRAFT_356356 [Linnemannia elongata]
MCNRSASSAPVVFIVVKALMRSRSQGTDLVTIDMHISEPDPATLRTTTCNGLYRSEITGRRKTLEVTLIPFGFCALVVLRIGSQYQVLEASPWQIWCRLYVGLRLLCPLVLLLFSQSVRAIKATMRRTIL